MRSFLFMMLLASSLTFAQDKGETNFSFGAFTAPGTYIDFGHEGFNDDGFNIGVQAIFNSNWFYGGAELYAFPDLRGYNYFHLGLKGGINQDFKILEQEWLEFNVYTGVRINMVNREGGIMLAYPSLGWDVGLEYRLPHKPWGNFVSIGGTYSNVLRTDGKAYDPTLDTFKSESGFFYINYTIRITTN